MPSARALCAILGLLAATPANAREFRASDIYPTNYPTVQAFLQMDRLIRERSAGRDGITVLGRNDGESEADMVAHVRSGDVDMARVNISSVASDGSLALIPSLPYLFKSTAQTRRVLDGPVGDEILAGLADQGLIGLCFYDAGPRSFYSSRRPIRTVADLKGLKVRVQQSDLWSAAMRALGAEPVSLRFERISRELESGAIEAADNNWPSYVSTRHYNVAKYFSRTEHSMAPTVLIFSKKTWDGLSREDQALIRGGARDSLADLRRLWDDYESSSRKVVEAAGGEIVPDVDRKSFSDALLPLYPTLIQQPRLREAVRRIQSED